ncbi:MAG: DUF4062 domain-containing protein [Nitrospiraceae bacterium]|nr:DUF4062 domain-containing protein [Nitrospiraceae bacterium]
MTRRDLIFRIFVSSTFSDSIVERDVLQRSVFPRLREHCRMRNARFQAIDLRWGVSQEAALNQQTMNICIQELKRCQEMSPKPNFLVLLGDRYGWRPLPAQVPADEFEALLDTVPEVQRELLVTDRDVRPWRDGDGIRRVGWYRRDENAVPLEYVLQSRRIDFPERVSAGDRKRIQAEEAQDWGRIESELRRLLTDAMDAQEWPRDDERRRKYERSATHHEAEHGALGADVSPENNVFAYFRSIDGFPTDESAALFRDMRMRNASWEVDADSQGRLDTLKSDLKGCLPQEHVLEYAVAWDEIASRNADPAVIDIEALPDDLSRFCERVEADLRRVIDAEIDAFDRSHATPREQELHRAFGEERRSDFVGRADALRRIEDYLNDPEDRKPLVVHGHSGSGKTALMAQAWTTLTDSDSAVARFIGATPASADLRTLLASLCEQLGVENPPSDMNELTNAFRDHLAGSRDGEGGGTTPAPAVVFLDALDQLNPTDSVHMLYWLPHDLADGVKLVVSVLDEESDAAEEERIALGYGAGEFLDIATRFGPEATVEVGPLQQEEGETLLGQWLENAGRALQSEQAQDILAKFARGDNGRPLYLKLAFEEARLWHSWEGLPCGSDSEPGLNDSVEGILEDLFHRLEQPCNHGRLLVERALGGIAAAKNGLTEDEMIDILSRDPDVYADFVRGAHHIPSDLRPHILERIHEERGGEGESTPEHVDQPVMLAWLGSLVDTDGGLLDFVREVCRKPYPPRVPAILWARLRADLNRYMTERRADGTVVMSFYHRQVGKAVARRYLGDGDRLDAHLRLGDYFDGLDYWAESIEVQRERARRLPPTPRPANIRKVVELPYHRLEAAKLGGKDDPESPLWDTVADLLTDWQFLEAKAEADPNSQGQETVNHDASSEVMNP